MQGTRPLHDAHHVVHGVRVDRGALSINLVTRTGWWSGLTRLHLIGYASHLGVIRRTLPLPSHSGWVPLRDSQSDRTVARASVTRGWRRARLRIPLGALVRSDRLFIKLEHRELFFDTAGWRDVLHLGRQVNETGDPNLAAQTCEVSPKRQAMSRLSG